MCLRPGGANLEMGLYLPGQATPSRSSLHLALFQSEAAYREAEVEETSYSEAAVAVEMNESPFGANDLLHQDGLLICHEIIAM